MIARLILVPLGLLFAAAAAFVCMAVGSVASPGMAMLVVEIVQRIGDVAAGAVLGDAEDARRIATLAGATWKLGTALIFAPSLIVAMISEVFGVRSFLFIAGGVAVLTAALPYALLPATTAGASGLPGPLVGGLFTSGLVAGVVYWLVAGRGAGGERPARRGAEPPGPPPRP